MKILIIDDEKNIAQNLNLMLVKYCTHVEKTMIAHSSAEAKELVKVFQPDLLLLDIQMPIEDGFSFLKSVAGISFEVIFVTAHDTYGIQAAKFSAIDYLLKPVDPTELTEAVSKAFKRVEQKKENLNLKNLIQYLNEVPSADQKIAISTLNETKFILIKDIIRIESKNVYSSFYTNKQEPLLVSKPLKFYETILTSYNFIRVHQSHLVNKMHIDSLITKDGFYLLMSDKSHIPVSRQKKDLIKKVLFNK